MVLLPFEKSAKWGCRQWGQPLHVLSTPRSSSGLHFRGSFGREEPKWTQDLLYLQFGHQRTSEYRLAPNPIGRFGCSRGLLWELRACWGVALGCLRASLASAPQSPRSIWWDCSVVSAGSFACRISAGNPVKLVASLLDTAPLSPWPSTDVSSIACLARLDQVIWALRVSGCRYKVVIQIDRGSRDGVQQELAFGVFCQIFEAWTVGKPELIGQIHNLQWEAV